MRVGEGAARGTGAGSSSQLEEQKKTNQRVRTHSIKVNQVLSNHDSILTFLVVLLNIFVPQ